jgi:chemotaxis protein CheD
LRKIIVLSLPEGNQIKNAGLAMPKRIGACQQIEPQVVVDTNTTYTHPQLEEVRVDMAGYKVDCRPVELVTSVGSCIGICLYDSIRRCGGLAHIMLPHASLGSQEPLPGKYADTAVAALVKGIRGLSKSENRLSAKIAGGANMFANTTANGLDIGAKNIRATKEVLEQHRIRLIGEDVGGSHGRRIAFNLVSGVTVVRLHNGEIRKL